MRRSPEISPAAGERHGARPAGAGESQFSRTTRRENFASNDSGGDGPFEKLGLAADEECRFEIFREDEKRMTSTLFSGGDWRWRLVTTSGLVLAEAAGYPSEPTCRAAVAVLQMRAASAPIVEAQGHGS